MPRYRLAALAALLLLPLIVFYRPLFAGEAFLPADLLSYLSPWKAVNPPANDAATWNVLRFDGITQFYPWRVEAARQVQAGQVPLFNSHQFAAEEGGTPLLANSQSAPLYPLHLLFYIAPSGAIWYIFGLVAALHLLIAATGLYALLRACGLRRGACVLGAAVWTLSAPVICWLSLPSFLSVSCWAPWLLLCIRWAHTHAGTATGRWATLGAGGVAGLMILAGHLQLALYAALAGLLYAVVLGISGGKAKTIRPVTWLAGIALAGTLAICLAAPQVLPAVELSRVSHRAVTDKSMQLYSANNATALPVRNFVTLLVPDFFGHSNRATYWNDSDRRTATGQMGNNYGEWAAYVGVLPLVLSVFALTVPSWRSDKLYFALLLAFALLIATGTPLNLVLFYVVPGYASMANPGRVLTVAALAFAALAAFGAEALFDERIPAKVKQRGALIALTVPVFAAAIGMSFATNWARDAVPEAAFGLLLAQAMPGMQVALVLLVLSAIALFLFPRLATTDERKRLALAFFAVMTIGDLAFWGTGYNPTSKPDKVYPVTPGIAYLQANSKEAKIAVLNNDWSLGQRPPTGAILPPNALTVYGLHDVAGYDSLFRKVAKEHITAADGGRDASPPANGNMVFVKSVQAAIGLGARYIVFAPDTPSQLLPSSDRFPNLRAVYNGADLVILENPDGENLPTGKTAVPEAPFSFRLGLYLALCGAGVFGAAVAASVMRRPRI